MAQINNFEEEEEAKLAHLHDIFGSLMAITLEEAKEQGIISLDDAKRIIRIAGNKSREAIHGFIQERKAKRDRANAN